MRKNAIEGDGSPPLPHDDGEHFEFEFLRLIKIKCKRVTKNVIIVIAIVILAMLIAYLISKR
jgi:hypothetical protein